MDVQPIIDGLQVSGIGMGMTSVVLVVLALSIRAVSWLDNIIERRRTERAHHQETSKNLTDGALLDTSSEDVAPSDSVARAAAIAVALELSIRSSEPAAVSESSIHMPSTNTPSDSWLTEGRARQRSRHGTIDRTGVRR